MIARAAHFLRETPVFFIGTVLVIAITFRLGVGAIKTASAEPEAPPPPAIHTPVATPAKPAPVVVPAVATPVVQAEPPPATSAAPPKRKPRTHGKR